MFRTQLVHLGAYFRENLQGRAIVSNRNSIRAIFSRGGMGLRSYLARVLFRMLRDNSYTSVALKMPIIFLVIWAICHTVGVETSARAASLMSPILAAMTVFVLVNLRVFLFLGEAERYLNHVAIFIAFFAADYAVSNDLQWILGGILLYGLAFWGLETTVLNFFKPSVLKDRAIEDARIIEDLKTLPPTNVLAYPHEAVGGTFRIGLQTNHLSIYSLEGAFTDLQFTKRFNERFSDGFPYVQIEKLDEMADEYGIGYVIVDRRSLKLRGHDDWKPSPRWNLRAVGGEVYSVYSRLS